MPYDTPIKDVAQALRYLETLITVERAVREIDVARCVRDATLALVGPAAIRAAAESERNHFAACCDATDAKIARLRELRDLLVAMEGNRDA